MSLEDMWEGADALYFNRPDKIDLFVWSLKQWTENFKNQTTIEAEKTEVVGDNAYVMRPTEDEGDVSARMADSFAKMCAVMEAYCIFLNKRGIELKFDNSDMEQLMSNFRKDYEDKKSRERFLYNPDVLADFQLLLIKYRTIMRI